jgi:hypothetical protein
VTLRRVLRVNFSGIFSKCVPVCLAIFFKTEQAHTALSIQQFLAKKKWLWCPTTPTHPTSLLATFFLPTDEAGFEMEALC